MTSYLRGTRKALERAPHRLFGNKSVEDRVIVEWAKDFKVAQDALHFLTHEIKNWTETWKKLLDSQADFATVFAELYRPIVEDKHNFKEPQVTPKSVLAYVTDYEHLAQDLAVALLPLTESLCSVACNRINTVRAQLESIEKRLTKRAHKKIDYDKASESLHKAIKKSTNSEKDKLHIDTLQARFDEATEIFMAIDGEVRTQVPQYLAMLSEFLNPFTTWIFYQQMTIYELLQEKILEFSVTQGLTECSSVHPQSETFREISGCWRDRFPDPLNRAEEGLKTIRGGETVKTDYDDWDSEKHFYTGERHAQFFDKAKDDITATTMGLVDKAQKPFHHDKPVLFSSDQGLFQGEADPLGLIGGDSNLTPVTSYDGGSGTKLTPQLTPQSSPLKQHHSPLKTPASPVTRRSRAFSNLSNVSTSTNANSGPTPITCRLEERYPSDVTRRARAWSSSSARALSPRHMILEEVRKSWASEGEDVEMLNDDESGTPSFGSVIALFPFSGQQPGDVAFEKGDTLKLLYNAENEDWWVGQTKDGRYGFFPRNRVGMV